MQWQLTNWTLMARRKHKVVLIKWRVWWMERECYTSLACTATRENLSKLEWLQMSLRRVV